MKLNIKQAWAEQGPLFAIATEDGEAIVFHTTFQAETEDGRVWRHSRFCVPGYGTDSEGFNNPNRNYKNEAKAILDRIQTVGVLDTKYWEAVRPEPCLEARLADYAYEEAVERAAFNR